ncbi:MAG: hypothetical protein JWO57_121 [Pseudonocardiales bacterium]|nr:hypothetical protein [Pseudonocardiales bacterium]
MFIQVFQGKVKDEPRLRERFERWQRDLMPGASGYLGTTAGTTDDGTFVVMARFESPEAAMRNSERPEQGEWWKDTEACFDGDVSFMNFTEVHTWLAGGSDDAGFVQIMEGRSSDPKRMHEMMQQSGDRIHEARPEIIGGLMAEADDGRYVDAIYFTSEAEAREHEKMDMPADLKQDFDENMKLMGEVTYFDLHRPMLVSAKR